jgi:hypothetical protein
MSRTAELERECVRRLKPVRFGVYSSTARIVATIEKCLASNIELSYRQQLALYAICWRYRKQIDDNHFTARLLIVERLAVERAEVTELLDTSVSVRAWRGNGGAQPELP